MRSQPATHHLFPEIDLVTQQYLSMALLRDLGALVFKGIGEPAAAFAVAETPKLLPWASTA